MEENRRPGGGTNKPYKEEFTDLVLSWSLQDILNDNLYQYQVDKIPDSFGCVDEYFGSYIFPLLEETRAELASAAESVHNTPFAEVASSSGPRHGRFLYDVQVGSWRNRSSDGGRRTLPGDVVLLSDSIPESVSDLLRVGSTYTFASVMNIHEGDEESDGSCSAPSSSFTLKSARQIEFGYGEGKSVYVVYLINVTPHKRIWKALHMRRNLTIIEKLLSKNDSGEEICGVCCHKYNNEIDEKLLYNSNGSQLDSVLACISESECDHKSSVELIWGPPGIGKTATLSRLLCTLLRTNVRTLVCAPTNVAIKELASRVVSLVRNSVLKESGEINSHLPCPLGDMLVFGNKDRLKVGSEIDEIFLDYRVKMLASCLGSLAGWKHCISSMLDFLEDCVAQHKILLENEIVIIEANNKHLDESKKSLLEFARDRFPHLAAPLRDCMIKFFTHLPRNLTHEHHIHRSILQLMSLLDSVEILLFDDNSLTSHGTVLSCVDLLRSLRASLDKIGMPSGVNATATTELCFRNATLIFCTASSAYKLHTVDSGPFDLLVIDEAAQVKECESIIALQIPGVRRAILVGDECQLPATVNSKLSEEAGYGRSMFQRLSLLEQLQDLLSGESLLFKNSRWKVLLSDNFRKSFQKLKPFNVKKLVLTVLLKLASGWRPKNINVDYKCESSSYIVKQIKVARYYVVCSIDLVKDPVYVQIFKVWDVLPTTDTTKLLKRLDNLFAMYTDDFIDRSNDKLCEGNLEVPKSWSDCNDVIRFKNRNDTKVDTGASVECRSHVENAKVNESLLLMKFYSLSSDVVNRLLTDVEGREVDLPFEVTDEEREIIRFPRSSFILGRSGTGKTTILTMKLYQKLQHYCIATRDSMTAGGDRPILRQLFVTVSPKLCYAVKKHVTQLKRITNENTSGNSSFTDMDDLDEMAAEFRDIPDTFVGIGREKYPLIITFHKFLMMLDGTLGNSYFQRFRDARASSQYEGRRSVALQTSIRRNQVTYERFRSSYWPHFNAKLTKILDPSRVFTEIMSHIKGGESGDGKRSREGYVSLSDGRVSTLGAEKRDAVYDIFEDYEKVKSERGEFDLADFVIDIHLRLKNEDDLMGDKMDFVYIDEVQDLTTSQISLFRSICKNVDEGFVFCGDTAQTIARGIDFRFEDIRSLFYSEFLMKSSRNCEFPGRREKGVVSDTFCLSQNFRTHTGVLRLAQSVVDLICHFFPQSIDTLPPETSLIYGESPVVLEPGSDENSIMSIFGHSGNAVGKWVGFGADQVILVRDDSARREIFNCIGNQALVLTIVECKGLEFQDVLLYNFFGSSPMSDQWRVLYEFLKEKDLLDANTPKSFPIFSESRHNILCSELKQLYVAITRTRQRLWICENNEELSKPILDYWTRLCLVQVRKIDDSLAAAMRRASSPEEWKSQGIKLFWEKNYEMATMCFEKAGEETWEKRAKASGLRASSDSLRGSNPKEARVMLREAAEIFDSIDKSDTAAECFCDLGEYERAGRIYLEKCGTSELRKAGECFSLAGSYKIAAEVYNKGNIFDECLSACTKGNHLDLGLRYIEQWKQQAFMTRFKEVDKIAQEFLEKCALECKKKRDSSLMMRFVRAFCTEESKRNFLKSLDLLEELLVLEEDSGNFREALEIAQRLGHTLREIDLLEKAGDYRNASLLVLSYVLTNSLWLSGTRGWPLKSFPQKEELLAKAISCADKAPEIFRASICAEAESLSDDQRKLLSELMQCYSDSKQYKSRTGEILSIRKLLEAHFEVHPTKYESDHELQIDPSLFEERMAKDEVSGGTLVFVWNLWKVKCFEILECLDSLEKRVDLNKCEDTARFCLSYFGARLQNNNSSGTYVLMNPNAAWIRNSDKGFFSWKRKVATLGARHFASAAREYWCRELVSAGLRVLEALEALYNFYSSRYCQSVCLVHIFDITKFVESKSLGTEKLHNFLQLCTKYFRNVFPLDPRESLSEDMLSLRETEISNNLLEEIISRNVISSGNDELTYRQIGLVAMTMLGSGLMPKKGLHRKIISRLSENSSWKSFIKNLESPRFSEEARCHEFHRALVETYSINWRARQFISPKCFFYLVERLLILVPHSRGHFFTTKSSFVEYLMCLPPDANPSAGLVFTDEKSYATSSLFYFVVSAVRDCLFNCGDTAEWISRSNIDCNHYFPILMLRLFMILCLSCLNSELPFDALLEVLKVYYIKSQLPLRFYEAIRLKRMNKYVSCETAVAAAFKTIGDSLVIVASTEDSSLEFVCPNAIFLGLKSFSCRNEVIKKLFPRSTDGDKKARNVVSEEVAVEQSPKTTLETNLLKGGLQIELKWNIFREFIDALGSLRSGSDGDSKSLVMRKKAAVEEHINCLTAEIADLSEQQRSHSVEDKNVLDEFKTTIEEMTEICSLLDTSDFDVKVMPKIDGILKILEERRYNLLVQKIADVTKTLEDRRSRSWFSVFEGAFFKSFEERRAQILPSSSNDPPNVSSAVAYDDKEEDGKNISKNGKGKSKKQPKKGKGKGKGGEKK
ncbi:hypothetical protein ABFX02_04G115400 [Erythranthe guttata]